MKPGPPRPPKSSLVPFRTGNPELQRVFDLTEERNQRLEVRRAERAKHGRRFQYRHLDYRKWKRDFDGWHLIRVLGRLGNQAPDDDPIYFKPGSVGLTIRELRVMMVATAWHSAPQTGPLNAVVLGRETGLDKGNLTKVLRALGEANLIINLAGNSAPNLAPNPILGFWDLRKLPELRKARSGRTVPPWSR